MDRVLGPLELYLQISRNVERVRTIAAGVLLAGFGLENAFLLVEYRF